MHATAIDKPMNCHDSNSSDDQDLVKEQTTESVRLSGSWNHGKVIRSKMRGHSRTCTDYTHVDEKNRLECARTTTHAPETYARIQSTIGSLLSLRKRQFPCAHCHSW
eukprot:3322041-Amphidinium_carterae.1